MVEEIDVNEIKINEVKIVNERQVTEIQKGEVEEVPLPPTGMGDIPTPIFLIVTSMIFIMLIAAKVFAQRKGVIE